MLIQRFEAEEVLPSSFPHLVYCFPRLYFHRSLGSSLRRGGAGWTCEWLIVSVLLMRYNFNLCAVIKVRNGKCQQRLNTLFFLPLCYFGLFQ